MGWDGMGWDGMGWENGGATYNRLRLKSGNMFNVYTCAVSRLVFLGSVQAEWSMTLCGLTVTLLLGLSSTHVLRDVLWEKLKMTMHSLLYNVEAE